MSAFSTEMVTVPAGTNGGVDPDFGSYSLTMTNTVLMDATEISYSTWRDVCEWAVTNGYQFDNPGERKDVGHPVHSIDWYDCAKWCNARSEMDGLTPCYSVTGGVYRTGSHDAVTDYNASGYRLPTWTEFEYAARGGLAGQRFPWGEFITHGEANYFSSSAFDYDLSPTKGGHPDYAYGDDPHSAPCGSFPPNAYGLYDISGNIWEWCNNAAGTDRHARSGGGNGDARWLRCGASKSVEAGGLSDEEYHSLGFRTLRAFNVVENPEFSPDGGLHPGGSVQVAITCGTVGATIRYETGSGTVPGADPDESSSVVPVSGMVSAPVPGWLKAKAWKDGASPSIVKSAVYGESGGGVLAGWRYPMNDMIGHACLEQGATVSLGGAMAVQHTIADVESVLTGDVDGDGQLEIVVSSGSTMRIHNGSGVLEHTVDLPRDSFLAMLEDADGDGTPEIFLGGKGSGFTSYVYDGNGTLLQAFEGLHAGGSDVTMRPIGLSNGKMLVGYNAGYARTPRGVAAFDYGTAAEEWYYQIGPANGLYSVADMDADGNLDITMSAHTVHNGASGNGTTDGDLYTIVVDEDGTGKLTRIYDSPSNGNSSHVFVDLDADGTHDVLGFKGHDSTYYPGQAKIHRFATDGTVLNTFNGPNNSRWTGLHAVGDLDGDGVPEIVATAYYSATSTKTFVLDANLVQLAESSIVGKVELLADIDGDGHREVVLLSPDGMVSLLGQDLSLLSSLQIEGQGSEIIASDLGGDGRIELLCRVGGNLHIVQFLTPDGLTIEPNASFVSSGTTGVGFDPSSMTYSLSNTGTTALAWTAVCGDSWIDLSAEGGTLAPGASYELVVGFSVDTLALPAGSHEALVEIAVQGASSTQQRTVLLTVVEPTGDIAVEDSILPINDRAMDFGQSVLNEESVEQITIQNTSAQYDLVVEGVGLSWSESGGAQALNDGACGADTKQDAIATASQTPPPTTIVSNAEYRPGVLLVGYTSGKQITAAAKADLHVAMGTESIKTFSRIPAEMVKLPVGAKLEKMIEAYTGQPGVAYAEPDYLLNAYDLPDDSRFAELWGMHNTGQTGGTPGADIGAAEAWDITTGNTNVIVAVIDTGIDYTHPDLAANMWVNHGEIAGNGVDDDGNGFVDDVHGYDFAYNDSNPMDGGGHGTHCAGTIGAVGGNGVGVAGVNWRVRLMAVKFLNDSGSGYTSDAVDSLEYAVANGAHISNNSWGGGGYSSTLKAAIDAAGASGHLFVAAAGNSGANNDANPHYPSSYDCDNILAVASSDHNDNRSGFSCYGANSVDLAAPGSSILSTVPGAGYGVKNGTSMATPHVSGAAALLKSQKMNALYSELKQLLMNGVDVLPQWEGLVMTGGRLNVANSLLLSEPPFVLENQPTWPVTLSPGGSITFDVRKTARRAGLHEGLVSIDCNDLEEPVVNVGLFSDVVCDWMSVMPQDAIGILHEAGTAPVAISASFALENLGSGSITWNVSGAPWWLGVDPGQGSLAVGASNVVGLALDPGVSDLPQGTYEAVLAFSNDTHGMVQQRVVELTVTPATIAFFALDTDPGWTMESGWEFGVPLGGGSYSGDPVSGHTGANVLGYNLAGDYPNNLSEYWLTSSPVDCSGFTNVQLRFWRWLGIESSSYDHASIEVSNDGSSWHSVWSHDGGSFSEANWNEVVYDISAVADGAASVWVRWGMGTTDYSITYPGWNIDDIIFEGTPLGVYDTPIHYVNVSNSTPVVPYASWATAATSIQDAVDAASSNDTVLIADGTYLLSVEITVTNAILVRSLNSPEATIVDGQGSVRCFNLGSSACVLSGLSIQNGYVDYHDSFGSRGAGVLCASRDPLIEHCIVSSNTASGTGNGGGVFGGTINYSIIENNSGGYSGGGCQDSLVLNCRILGNNGSFGGAVAYGITKNSLIRGNRGWQGGALWESAAYNCTIVENEAQPGNKGGLVRSDAYNCIIVGNEGVDIDLQFGSSSHTCSPDVTNGVNGNITNAPVFVDAVVGNYHLAPSSPCINWGDNVVVSGATDLDGNPRLVGAYVDMGCYEYQGLVDPDDSDGDGLPDEWERLHFGGNVDPDSDADGDGQVNWQEQISGMDPRSSASVFAASNFVGTATGERIIQWPSAEGRYYNVYWKEDLQSEAGWIPVGVNIESGIFTDTVHGAESHGFYKLEVGTEPVSSANKVLSGIALDIPWLDYRDYAPLAYAPVRCWAHYSDGSSSNVSAVWEEDSLDAWISGGYFEAEVKSDDYGVTVSCSYGGLTDSMMLTISGRPVITDVEVVGPTSVTPSSPWGDFYYDCIVTYSDGSSVDMSGEAVWSDDWPSVGMNSGGWLQVPYGWTEPITVTATVTEYATDYSGSLVVHVNPTLDYVSISGPASVDEGETGQYSCTAHYSDGSSYGVDADSYDLDGFAYATIDSSGLLTALSVGADEVFWLSCEYEGRSDYMEVTIRNVSVPQPADTVLIDAGSNPVVDPVYGSETLTITNAIYMDQYLVTSSLWYQVYDWAETNGYDISINGVANGADHPITQVNWYDCAKWCNARSRMENRSPCYKLGGNEFKSGEVDSITTDFNANGFRMPTHLEWEYAARGGHSAYRYPWGNSISSSDANYGNNVGATTPVDQYSPNDYGLYDMVGNVWELCDTQYQTGERANAGGGFSSSTNAVHCGYARDVMADQPATTRWHIGFRTVCLPE
ncbi:S8 family serine peptidase [Pontiella desulfatans]|nr:S8 family serine peptidase [Pontiella desulfatans]